MSEINNALGTAGAGHSLTTGDGRRWFFCALTKAAQGDFEAWLEDRAWVKVVRARRHLSPEEYDRLIDRTQQKIDAGEYAPFGGKLDADGKPVVNDKLQKALTTEEGVLFFVGLLLKGKQPAVSRADVEYIMADQPERVALALRSLYPPKDPAPATTAAPTPAGA